MKKNLARAMLLRGQKCFFIKSLEVTPRPFLAGKGCVGSGKVVCHQCDFLFFFYFLSSPLKNTI